MKHQYFGDVNDFKKYAILRALLGPDLKLLVAWLLTPDDERSDGGFVKYLEAPQVWRAFDPALYDFLRDAVHRREERSVRLIEEWDGLTASYLSSTVPNDRDGRARWESELRAMTPGHDIVFFDPDNGIEVPSCPVGRKNSGKYVRWSELEAAWSSGASLLIYQHFRRVPRERFIRQMSEELCSRLGTTRVGVLRTPRVAFFLVPQERWADEAFQRGAAIAKVWNPNIYFETPGELSLTARRPGA